MTLRTLAEIRDAGRQAAAALPPPTQQMADIVAAILVPYVTAQVAA